MVYYPVLIGEMAKRQIKKKEIAEKIGICYRSFDNKVKGKVAFTWPEVKKIRNNFFPDISADELFMTVTDRPSA